MRIFFLDDLFNGQYEAERRFSRVFGIFAVLAIFVACLGLFGLTGFSAQQRTKEIGVRKVLGASVPGIAGRLSNEYAVVVPIALAVAWPATWIVMDRWLQGFAYRISPGFLTIVLAGTMVLFLAGVTVAYIAFRAARTNPVDVFGDE